MTAENSMQIQIKKLRLMRAPRKIFFPSTRVKQNRQQIRHHQKSDIKTSPELWQSIRVLYPLFSSVEMATNCNSNTLIKKSAQEYKFKSDK